MQIKYKKLLIIVKIAVSHLRAMLWISLQISITISKTKTKSLKILLAAFK